MTRQIQTSWTNLQQDPHSYAGCLPHPQADRKLPGLPESLAGWSVHETDGDLHVVVSATGDQKLWLDPQRGFSVQRSESYSPDGTLCDRTDSPELEKVEGVWLPREITWVRCGGPTAPEHLRGKPLILYTATFVELMPEVDGNLPTGLFNEAGKRQLGAGTDRAELEDVSTDEGTPDEATTDGNPMDDLPDPVKDYGLVILGGVLLILVFLFLRRRKA